MVEDRECCQEQQSLEKGRKTPERSRGCFGSELGKGDNGRGGELSSYDDGDDDRVEESKQLEKDRLVSDKSY